MKKLAIIILLSMLIGVFSSCAGIGDELPKIETSESTDTAESSPEFELFYEISEREYSRGDAVTIRVSVENISGKDLTYSAVINSYYPTIELYCNIDGSGVTTKLDHQEVDTYSGFDEFTAKAGQIGSYTYTFNIPSDATLGTYDVTLRYRDVSRTFTDVLMVTDKTSQNESEGYKYSPITVSSGSASVHPIRTLGSCYTQNADGTFSIGDGMGAWQYLGKKDISTYPLLVYDGDVKIEIPEYNDVYDIGIYGLDIKRINGYDTTDIAELNYLPAGEYIIVLSVQYNTQPLNPNEYENNGYDDFFRFSVPAKNSIGDERYYYSSTSIESDGFSINPIECMLWIEVHKGGETLCGDGFGVSRIIENKEDHSRFPTLLCKRNVTVTPPVNAYLSDFKVYDTEYNELDYTINTYTLGELLPGEYIIVFREQLDGRGCDPEITDYTVTTNECIFKLIVSESSVTEFSYDAVLFFNPSGTPGVKTDGFKNTSEYPVSSTPEAVERAKNECTIEYNAVTAQYDPDNKIWAISFFTRNVPGGDQTVYLNDKGITLLIIYGE